jgi:hypothetical protein
MDIQAHAFTAKTKRLQAWPPRYVLTLEYPANDAYHAHVVALISEFMKLEQTAIQDAPPSTEPSAPEEPGCPSAGRAGSGW